MGNLYTLTSGNNVIWLMVCNICCAWLLSSFIFLCAGQLFEHVVLRNSRPPLPPLMPEDYSLLLTSCWAINPAEQPSIAAVLDCLKLMIQERQLDM
jgi:hypothetical protein